MDNHFPAPYRLIIALELAAKAHVNQRRKSDNSPHLNHLIDVMSLLVKLGHDDENLLISAVLKDAIEDTDVSYDQLLLMFGEEVADTAKTLGDDKRLSMQERRLGQLRRAKSGTINHKLIELSDAIGNASSIPSNWSIKQAKESLNHLSNLAAICGDVCSEMHRLLVRKIDLAIGSLEKNKHAISEKVNDYIDQKRVFYCIVKDCFYLSESTNIHSGNAWLMSGKFDAYLRSIRSKKLSFCETALTFNEITATVSEQGNASIKEGDGAINLSRLMEVALIKR